MYEVLVGNIGTVYVGEDGTKAQRAFDEYVEQSKANYGRAAGEAVTMLKDNDIAKEYIGTLHD